MDRRGPATRARWQRSRARDRPSPDGGRDPRRRRSVQLASPARPRSMEREPWCYGLRLLGMPAAWVLPRRICVSGIIIHVSRSTRWAHRGRWRGGPVLLRLALARLLWQTREGPGTARHAIARTHHAARRCLCVQSARRDVGDPGDGICAEARQHSGGRPRVASNRRSHTFVRVRG